MKTMVSNVLILTICGVMMFLTNGCIPWGPGGYPEQDCVRLIKFTDPSYKDYILAYAQRGPGHPNATGKENVGVMRFNICVAHPGNYYAPKWIYDFPESHRNPYWELPNDWLLIDWRWKLFPYDRETSVIINKKWDEFYEGAWGWPREMVIDEYPIAEWKNVNISHIAKHIEKTYSEEMIFLLNEISCAGSHLDSIYGYDFCLCEVPHIMDSIWTILQQDLSDYIEDGCLK